MSTKGKATFQITGWEEKPYEEKTGTPKLAQAHVSNTFSGDIEGAGTAEYLMVYPDKDHATFVGLQRISGGIGAARGTFVLQALGTFEGGIAKADWSVVPDSGTGKLTGLTGTGSFASKSDGSADATLDYTL